ncbi:enoyl-CoA hydratase-related protein [Salicola sp. Rm-C-2C1-2]|uniref:enoyl-CoA hydratase-related protein n=1 Tax=Salicola sp. Rm-C-2C1-2 TaxID=3141321 RepID=UPI0032E4A63A
MSDNDPTVLVDTPHQGLRRIRLNRANKRNAFNASIIGELSTAIEAAAQDNDVRAVLLAAEGKHFSAGADLEWMQSTAAMTAEENRQDALALAHLMRLLDECPKPTLTRVQGAAFGGALGLICCSDIAIAATDARFCLSEVRLGLVPATIGPYVVRTLGQRQARRYMLSAELIEAEQAHSLGLIHELAAPGALDERVEAMAAQLMQAGPEAQAECKHLVRRLHDPAADDGVDEFTASIIARVRTDTEGQEGLRAFMQKETPAWRKAGAHE